MKRGLGARLEQLYTQRCSEPLPVDPVRFCHQVSGNDNQEIVACVSSILAYGGVSQISKSISRVLDVTGGEPARFIDNFDFKRELPRFLGITHRFTTGLDLALVFVALKAIRQEAGSLENVARRYAHDGITAAYDLIHGFSGVVLGLPYTQLTNGMVQELPASFRFLFPTPQSGSACKRMCMMLRWLVRPADGVDLGLWTMISPRQLIVPVDRHIGRISKLLGFTGTDAATWRNAVRITQALRTYDVEDPIKYDFALCHIGITEGCRGVRGQICSGCPIHKWCTVC